MKNFTFLILLVITVTLSSCYADRDDVPEVLSEWKLVAVESNDGTFMPTDRTETVSFLPNSLVSRSPYWCGDGGDMTVRYSDEGFIHMYCTEDDVDPLMFLIEEDIMVITDPSCTEGCKTKYERIR